MRLRRLLSSVMAAMLIALSGSYVGLIPTQTASAAAGSLPSPVAPSADCEWMGEAYLIQNQNYLSGNVSVQQKFRVDVSSTPVAGENCGLVWSASNDNVYTETTPANCTADPSDVNTYTYREAASGSGTGRYTAAVQDGHPDPLNKFVNFQANAVAGNGVWNSTTTNDLCGNNYQNSHPWLPGLTTSFCNAGYLTQTGFTVNPNTQATVGKCVYQGASTFQEVGWRLKKVNCDPAVNSDGGAASDCKEYDDRTNPMDPSDDKASISQEAQNVLNIASTTGSECYGEVMKLASKQAGSSKGITNVFGKWNLTGVPGVTATSSAQQKMEAVRDYCRTN